MDTTQTDPHVAAVIDMLTSTFPAEVAIYETQVPPGPTQAYAVLYSDSGTRERTSLLLGSQMLVMYVQITCVGTTAKQARDVADMVNTALIDRVPVVAGRVCWPITQGPGDQSQMRYDDPTRDPNVDRARFYLTPRFRVSSTV